MANTTLKSAGAIFTGFLVGALLSTGMDMLLEKTGFMKTDPFSDNPSWLILLVIVYRFIFNVTGCYMAASLAPNRPLRHAMIIGVIGLVLSIAGTAVMWDQAVAWYNISIILISLPSAWIGGKLKERKLKAA